MLVNRLRRGNFPARFVLSGFLVAAMLFLALLSINGGAQASVQTSVQAARGPVRLPTLMYHYISTPPAGSDIYRKVLSVTPEHFLKQMQWLKDNGYTTIAPDALADALLQAKPLGAKSVLLTFDDGYEDAYTTAFPILKQFGFKGTFFVVTDWIDQGRAGYLTWAQVKEMAQAGMSIQAHSRTHQSMAGRTKAWLDNEIVGSMDAVQAHTGIRPRFFAYPAGSYDINTLKAIKAAGIVAAFSTESGVYATTRSVLTLPRIRIRGSTPVSELAQDVRFAS